MSQLIPDDFEGVIYVTGNTVYYWRDRGPNPDISDMTRTERKVAEARFSEVLAAFYRATLPGAVSAARPDDTS